MVDSNSPVVSDNWELRGVHFTSADEGWAVGAVFQGNLCVVALSEWDLDISHTAGCELELVRCSGSLHLADEGWAVGYDIANSRGALLHYQNGNWTSVAPPVVSDWWYVMGVYFTSADEGWAVGNDMRNKKRGFAALSEWDLDISHSSSSQ